MAKAAAEREQYASLKSKDATEATGFFGPGAATIKSARFEDFEYKPKTGKSIIAPVLLVTYDRDGEEERVPYSVGSGWRCSKDGLGLIGRNGQRALANNTNAHYFLDSLERAGMPEDFMDTPDQLDGIDVVLMAKPMDRDFSDKDKGKGDGATQRKRSILVVEEVTDAPWLKGSKSKAKAGTKAKAKAATDDDDDDEEDEDEEAPKAKAGAKAKGKPAADDDDDDEPVAAKSKSKAGAKDEADEDDTEIDEEAVEALIEALDGGTLKQAKIEDAVRLVLKGNKQKNVIAARCGEDEFLEQEKGWTFDSKKGTVTAE